MVSPTFEVKVGTTRRLVRNQTHWHLSVSLFRLNETKWGAKNRKKKSQFFMHRIYFISWKKKKRLELNLLISVKNIWVLLFWVTGYICVPVSSMYVFMYVYKYIYVCICMLMYICVHVSSTYVFMYICMYVCIYVYLNVYMCLGMKLWVYECIYVFRDEIVSLWMYIRV